MADLKQIMLGGKDDTSINELIDDILLILLGVSDDTHAKIMKLIKNSNEISDMRRHLRLIYTADFHKLVDIITRINNNTTDDTYSDIDFNSATKDDTDDMAPDNISPSKFKEHFSPFSLLSKVLSEVDTNPQGNANIKGSMDEIKQLQSSDDPLRKSLSTLLQKAIQLNKQISDTRAQIAQKDAQQQRSTTNNNVQQPINPQQNQQQPPQR